MEKVKEHKPKKILLQVPEGLKTRALEISSELKNKTEAEIIISGEPCYGACDLRLDEAKLLGCDLILHFGHIDFGVKSEIPVVYVSVEVDFGIDKSLEGELRRLKEDNINIYSSEPFRKSLDILEKILENQGKKIGEKKIILGCSRPKARGEANLFVGSGRFHSLSLRGKTYFLDLEMNRLEDVTHMIEKEERKRQARIEKFKEAKRIGILLSKKPGQFYRDYRELKQKLEKEGKEVEILIFDEITNEKLLGLGFDYYVNTACPRILDGAGAPLINLRDLKE